MLDLVVYFLTVLGLLLFHGMVTYSLILKTLTGLPVEGIALIIGVDRLLNMVRKRRLGCNRVLSIEIKLVPVTAYQQNCSVLKCAQTGKIAIVDPGGDTQCILAQRNDIHAVELVTEAPGPSNVGFFELDLWLGRSRPGETIARALANVAGERGAEACQADPIVVAHAGIDDPGRSLSEKSFREHLGFDIAVRIKALLVGRISPNVVVLPAEICEIVVVGDAFLHPVDFSEFDRLVPGDLRL